MQQKLTIRHIGLMVCCCATAGVPAAMLVSTPGIFYPVIADDLGGFDAVFGLALVCIGVLCAIGLRICRKA